MTVCAEQLTFSFYHDKQLVADFKGGQISSDAGLLLLRELEERLNILISLRVGARFSVT
jgi:hypothetical protein